MSLILIPIQSRSFVSVKPILRDKKKKTNDDYLMAEPYRILYSHPAPNEKTKKKRN